MYKDSYFTILKPSKEILFKSKNSKFYSYAFPVNTKDDVKEFLKTLKKKHHSANHWCYAYQLGVEPSIFRVNDDGEPSNSAGRPIYGQIKSFKLTNVLIVVVRYFGGVKLGVGGLITAYKTSAQLALKASDIVEKTIDVTFNLVFEYNHLKKVLQILKQQGVTILKQKFEINCELTCAVRKGDKTQVFEFFENFFGVTIEVLKM